MTEKQLRRLHCEIRGGLLRQWDRETDLIGNVFACLHPSDQLYQQIWELDQDSGWVRFLPDADDEVRNWNERREAVLEAARRRVC